MQDSLEHQMQDLDQDIALLVAEIQHNNIGIAIQLTGNVRIIPENYLGFDEINNHDRIEQGNQILGTGKAIAGFPSTNRTSSPIWSRIVIA